MSHLTEQQTTYLAHLARAWRLAARQIGGALFLTLYGLAALLEALWVAGWCVIAAVVLFTHGLLPFLFTSTGSRMAESINRRVNGL
jgi:hypothetical protein